MDQIDRELASALSIEPSPEFQARVRARIAGERAPRTWYLQWRVIAGAAALPVVSVVIAIAIGRVNVTENSRTTAIAVNHTPPETTIVGSVPAAAAGVAETAAHRQAPRVSEPEVLVPQTEVRGLRQLAAIAHDGRVQFVFPEREFHVEREPATDIVVAPIVIAPLEADVSAAANLNAEGD